jgi:hypothetical protein
MGATCSTDVILLNLSTVIIFGEAYKLRSHSLNSLYRPPTTSSLLVRMLLWTLYSQATSIYAPELVEEIKFHNHTKQEVKNYGFVYFNFQVPID